MSGYYLAIVDCPQSPQLFMYTHWGGKVKFMNIMGLTPIIALCYLAKVKYFADLSKVSNQLTLKSVKEKLSWPNLIIWVLLKSPLKVWMRKESSQRFKENRGDLKLLGKVWMWIDQNNSRINANVTIIWDWWLRI